VRGLTKPEPQSSIAAEVLEWNCCLLRQRSRLRSDATTLTPSTGTTKIHLTRSGAILALSRRKQGFIPLGSANDFNYLQGLKTGLQAFVSRKYGIDALK
jgi:hypothetical protein